MRSVLRVWGCVGCVGVSGEAGSVCRYGDCVVGLCVSCVVSVGVMHVCAHTCVCVWSVGGQCKSVQLALLFSSLFSVFSWPPRPP